MKPCVFKRNMRDYHILAILVDKLNGIVEFDGLVLGSVVLYLCYNSIFLLL